MCSNNSLAFLSAGTLFGLICSSHYDTGMLVCAGLALTAFGRCLWCEGQRAALKSEQRDLYDALTPTLKRTIDWSGLQDRVSMPILNERTLTETKKY